MTTLGTFKSNSEIENSVLNVLKSGRLTYGPVSKKYEKEFADLHQCSQAIVTNSGTSSLVVIIQAMKELYGWNDGDQIIVPSTTFVATVNAVIHCNLTPVLVDVEELFYCIDPFGIEDQITPTTRAIIPVHAFGQPAQMDFIKDIADDHDLKIIEDSCESMFVDYQGKSVGSWGDAAAFSTYSAHVLSTGVGGLVTVRNNPDLALKIRSLVNHGIDIKNLPSGDDYEPTFMARNFKFNSIGHSFRITELESAIGLAQLDDFHNIITRRTVNSYRLTELLFDLDDEFIQLPMNRVGAEHAWMVYPIVIKEESGLNKFPIMAKLRSNGIECRDLLPLTTQPCYDFIDPGRYPVSQWLNTHGFYIGCHQDISDEELVYMSEVLHEGFS